MSDLWREATDKEIGEALSHIGPAVELFVVPVEPVGTLTVDPDGYRWDTEAIREGRMGVRGLPLDPGKYLLIPLEADDE